MVYVRGVVRLVVLREVRRKDGGSLRVQRVLLSDSTGNIASGYVPVERELEVGTAVELPVVSAAVRRGIYHFWGVK